MSGDHVIELLRKNVPWDQWSTGSKSIFCLMFSPMGDLSYSFRDRSRARKANVHLFNRYKNAPPEFVATMLSAMPQLTKECMYPHARDLCEKVLASVPPRPIGWPAIN